MLALSRAPWLRRRLCSTWHRLPILAHSSPYSTVGSHELVKIPVRTNGHIELDIHHPITRPPLESPSKLIIHLPRGPLAFSPKPLLNDASEALRSAKSLASITGIPVVTVHYRLSRAHLFPTPIHDVLAGYDWILQNLLLNADNTRTTAQAAIGVTGTHIGGTLALALALTESRLPSSDPNTISNASSRARVVAAAVEEAVCDWVSEVSAPDTRTPALPPVQSASTGLTRRSLQRLRNDCFPRDRPDRYFDPFASPVHFLRSPSGAVPREYTLEENFAALVGLEGYDRATPSPVASPRDKPPGDEKAGGEDAGTRRKGGSAFRRPLKYPPSGSVVRIPSFRFAVGTKSVLRAQNEEMVGWVRRAVVRSERRVGGVGDRLLEEAAAADGAEGSGATDDLVRVKEEAERQVLLDVLGEGHDAARHLTSTAHWLRTVLDSS